MTKKTTKKKAASKKKTAKKKSTTSRTRTNRPYPASAFHEALALGQEIMNFAAGEKVRRLTLLEKMNKSQASSSTKMMITNSNKYGITKGSYNADFLELTDKGRVIVDNLSSPKDIKTAEFELAINTIPPFKLIYTQYKDKRIPEKEIIKDFLKDSNLSIPNLDECIDTFTVNIKEIGLLRTIGGSVTLTSIEQLIENIPQSNSPSSTSNIHTKTTNSSESSNSDKTIDWDTICFYITPIGNEDSIERKHADLFISALVRPALEEIGLTIVRADEIALPGMITSQVLEYLKKSKLAIADLSFLNPNVFYEVALRHALRLPVVQLIRKADKLPFDVNQLRTLIIDNSDIYTLIPELQTIISEIASHARSAIDSPESVGNPISVFYPQFYT